MKTQILIGAMLCSLSGLANAQAWLVDVKLTYLNSRPELVSDVPVLSFRVPVGTCVRGLTRTEDMIPEPVQVTQKICIDTSGDTTKIEGWVFAKDRITDLAFTGDRGASTRGALNYGQPVQAQTNGSTMIFSSGHYTITAKKEEKS